MNSPGDSSAGSTWHDLDQAGLDLRLRDRCRGPSQRVNSVFGLSSNMNMIDFWPRCRRRDAELRGDRRLAGAGAADDQRAGAFLDAAAEQLVQLGDARTRASPPRRCRDARPRPAAGNTSRPPLLIT